MLMSVWSEALESRIWVGGEGSASASFRNHRDGQDRASACHGSAQEPGETAGGAPLTLVSPQPLLGP